MFHVICLILIIFFYKMNMPIMTAQILMIYVWLALSETTGIVAKELDIAGYSKEKYKKIGNWSKLLRLDDHISIPKPIKVLEILLTIQIFVFSIALWCVAVLYKPILFILVGGYLAIALVTLLIFTFNAYRISFYKKFKRVTIHNWIYLFGQSRFKKAIQSIKIGKCIIVSEQLIRGKQYFIVEVKKTGRKYEKVMYCGREKMNKDNTYVLYEIKKVYYIV